MTDRAKYEMEIEIDPLRLKDKRKKRNFEKQRDDVFKGVGAKAAELRRRLFNRRHEKEKLNAVELPMVKKAKNEGLDIRLSIIEQDVKSRIIDANTTSQFELEGKIRHITNNIQGAKKNVRESNATLDDLTRRIESMRDVNNASSLFLQPPTQQKVENELDAQYAGFISSEKCQVCGKVLATASLLSIHQRNCCGIKIRDLPQNMTRCDICHRATNNDFITQHRAQCDEELSRKKRIWANSVYGVKGQLPEAPTSFRLIKTSHNSITVAWKPPVFTASLEIIDYEIQIHVLVVEKFQLLKHRQHEKTFSPLQAISTSRWNRPSPVATHSFTINQLQAKTTYGHLCVRCKTDNGWSGWSNEISEVITLDPVPPSEPLFLVLGLVTENSITVSWTPPFYFGGDEIDEYIVAFSGYVQVQDGNEAIDLSASELKDFTRRFKCTEEMKDAVNYTIEGLRSGHIYSRVRVSAVSASGLISKETPELPQIRTLTHGKEMQMLAELQEAINSPATFIDSSFYNGFAQRYERKHYIQLVAATVKKHYPTLTERVDAMIPVDSDSEYDSESSFDSESDSSVLEDTEAKLIQTPEPLPLPEKDPAQLAEEANRARLEKQKIRRKQFQYRLHQLRTHVETLEYNIHWAEERSVVLISMMEAAEQRTMDKQAELERARAFKGPSMDSIAMHGGLQRFYTPALISALEEELDIEKYYIVDTKEDLRQVEDQKKADIVMLEKKKQQITTRQVALDNFETSCEIENLKANRGAAVLLKFKSRQASFYFGRWNQYCVGRRADRAIMSKAMQRLIKTKVLSAWTRWVTAIHMMQDAELGLTEVVGKGGKDLKEMHAARVNLQNELYTALHQCRDLNKTLQTTVVTAAQNSKRLTNVFEKERAHQTGTASKAQVSLKDEADTLLDIGEYDTAIQAYEKCLHHLAKEENTRAIQTLTSVVYNKIGRAHYLLNSVDHAATAFAHAESIAQILADPLEGAIALRGRADCHMAKREWSNAMDLYLKAAGGYEDVSDITGEVACWRGLSTCYHEIDANDLANEAALKADSLAHALDLKMGRIKSTLENLHSRLIGVSVKLSVERQCERVGGIVPRLRQERLNCKIAIMEEEKVLAALETMLEEKQNLFKQAEADLKQSESSDSLFIDSVKNIQVLMEQLKILQLAIETERKNSKIRISNQQDRIAECEEELKAETGPLMRRVRGKDPLRCFRFNAVNASYKNVLGRASGGVDTAIASVGPHVLVYDLITGVCMGQAVGDVDGDKRHLGDPTGHTKAIMVVFCRHSFVYTGGMDCTLLIWELVHYHPILRHRITDFDAAIMAITATNDFLVAGTADCCIMVHDVRSYERIAFIPSAHYRTINFLMMDLQVLCSGGADHEIRFWDIRQDPTTKKYRYTRGARLRPVREGETWKEGHCHPVSCVHFAANEVVSGDRGGTIVVWDGDKAKMRRQMQVHSCAITCLSFDTLRIVSGGTDGTICITDLVSGILLQTLHGHTTKVLDVQVDRLNLVSCSEDGVLRQWKWHSRDGDSLSSKRYHILGPGETLRSISLAYRTSVAAIRDWNHIDDVTKLYLGQQLLVQKELPPDDTEDKISVVLGKLSREDTSFLLQNRMSKEELDKRISDIIDRLTPKTVESISDGDKSVPQSNNDANINEPEETNDESDDDSGESESNDEDGTESN